VPELPPDLRLERVSEPHVDAELDRELRAVLAACFIKPRDAFFRERRYANEMPSERWLVRDRDNLLVAHLASHEKTIGVGERELRIGGVAEVCVLPEYRGRGLVRYLVSQAHAHFRDRALGFGVLFGRLEVYGSSGYGRVKAAVRKLNARTQTWSTEVDDDFLVCSLNGESWPEGEVDLRGPDF
jgi:predicted acetyltransferase